MHVLKHILSFRNNWKNIVKCDKNYKTNFSKLKTHLTTKIALQFPQNLALLISGLSLFFKRLRSLLNISSMRFLM